MPSELILIQLNLRFNVTNISLKRLVQNHLMRSAYLILLTFVINNTFSQLYTGVIKDATTDMPLAFVNIGIPKKATGTVSQFDGTFRLTIAEENTPDTLRISMIGYKTKEIPVKIFISDYFILNKAITLEPDIKELSEVIIRPRNMKEVVLGNENNSPNVSAGFLTDDLGSELGTVMKLKDGKTYYLKSCGFNFAKVNYDSIIFRVNIYDLEDGLPGELLISLPIYVTVYRDQRNVIVDLYPYDIKIEEDFVLSLEWLQDLPDKTKAVMFCAGFFGNKVVFRQTSQANWAGFPIGIGIWCKAEFEK